MSEQAQLSVVRYPLAIQVNVCCDHYDLSRTAANEMKSTVLALVSRALASYEQHRPCHCSTAELWARYGNRPEKEGQ